MHFYVPCRIHCSEWLLRQLSQFIEERNFYHTMLCISTNYALHKRRLRHGKTYVCASVTR